MLPSVINKRAIVPIGIQPEKTTPVVSLFMPFEPKMVAKSTIMYKLKALINEAEIKLNRSFSAAVIAPLKQRMEAVVKNLDYSTHKKSIAMYVSAKADKVFYLDTPLIENVSVEQSFNIRSLVEAQQDLQHYILLVLDKFKSTIYFGNGEHLSVTFTNTLKGLAAMEEDKWCGNSSLLDNTTSANAFLKQTDNNLNIILNYFPSLPLIVVGRASMLNNFKIITQNETHITQTIESCSDETDVDVIKSLLHPYIQNWNGIKMLDLHRRLDNAIDSNKIAVGIENVIKVANQRRVKLLVLEKDYTFSVVKSKSNEHTLTSHLPFTDAVDEVIERVLTSGSEVVFASPDVLENYQHIALIYQ